MLRIVNFNVYELVAQMYCWIHENCGGRLMIKGGGGGAAFIYSCSVVFVSIEINCDYGLFNMNIRIRLPPRTYQICTIDS